METPLLSADTVVDRHLDPIPVALNGLQLPDFGNAELTGFWLQTSPEFAMKRLLAAGSGPIFQVCKAFRAGEAGAWHNPEFSMLEWYDPRLDYAGGRQQLGELACLLLGHTEFRQSTYTGVFQRHLAIDPLRSPVEGLAQLAIESKAGVEACDLSDRDLLLDILMSECIQPKLGMEGPEIVFDWPGTQAALARRRWEADVPVAERYELYCCGVELANGYRELSDAGELAVRSRAGNRQREQDGKNRLPETSRLLQAMESGFPPCCGCAMGLDRILMVQLGLREIQEVIAFPVQRA